MITRLGRLAVLVVPTAMAASEAEAVQRALAGGRPPWYDPAADGWRRIEIREPATPTRSLDVLPGVQLVAMLLLLGLLAAFAWLAWQLWRLRPAAAPAALAAPATAAQARAAADLSGLPLPDAHLPPDEGLRRALAAGDWRRAVVWAHARLLARLDAAGALRLERGATERQLLAAARAWAAGRPGRGVAVAALERTGAAFAAVYFGHAEADRAQVEALVGAIAGAERALDGAGG